MKISSGRNAMSKAVAAAGKKMGARAPYEIKALYNQADDPNTKLVVFADADGKQLYTTFKK